MPWEYVNIGDTSKKVLADVVDTDKYVQGIKLVDPTDGEDAPLVVTLGTQPAIPTALIDSTGATQDFATATTIIVTPGIDAGAYSTGDNLDGTILSFADAVGTKGTGWITQMWVHDDDSQVLKGTIDLQVWFLNASITPPAQNAAFALADADADKVCQVISTADGVTYSYTNGSWTKTDAGIPQPISVTTGTTLYAVVKVVGAPTWTATDALRIGVTILAD